MKYVATGFYSASIFVQHYLFGSLGNHITISNHAEPTAGVWNPSGSIRRTDIGYWFVVEGGKPENPGKKPQSKVRTNNKLNPHMAPGRNGTSKKTP